MSVDAALALLAILLLANYWISRSVLYPPIVFCGMWILDLFVYRLGLIEIDQIASQTVAILVAGALLFSLGSGLALLVPRTFSRIAFYSDSIPAPEPNYPADTDRLSFDWSSVALQDRSSDGRWRRRGRFAPSTSEEQRRGWG